MNQTGTSALCTLSFLSFLRVLIVFMLRQLLLQAVVGADKVAWQSGPRIVAGNAEGSIDDVVREQLPSF